MTAEGIQSEEQTYFTMMVRFRMIAKCRNGGQIGMMVRGRNDV